VLCHRVLRTLQQTAQISQLMDRQTWDTLLLFLLAINEILLAPPTVKDDVGDQLCERVLSVLFEVWLLACVRSFPSPSMWKTLQESCAMCGLLIDPCMECSSWRVHTYISGSSNSKQVYLKFSVQFSFCI